MNTNKTRDILAGVTATNSRGNAAKQWLAERKSAPAGTIIICKVLAKGKEYYETYGDDADQIANLAVEVSPLAGLIAYRSDNKLNHLVFSKESKSANLKLIRAAGWKVREILINSTSAPAIKKVKTVKTTPKQAPAVEAKVEVKPTSKRKIKRRAIVREKVEAPPAVEVKATIDPDAMARIEGMAFQQVRTISRMDKLEDKMQHVANTLETLSGQVLGHLTRIKAHSDDPKLFAHRMFNKLTIKLRKRSIDIQVEDLHDGIKRRRVFRCSDYSNVEHFMTHRTLIDGIEELKLTPIVRKRKPAPRQKRAKDISERRAEMEYNNEQNTEVPIVGKFLSGTLIDRTEAQISTHENTLRQKAERSIAKLCKPGTAYESAKDRGLVKALTDAGYSLRVAIAAADNCNRLSTNVKREYEALLGGNKSPELSSNEY